MSTTRIHIRQETTADHQQVFELIEAAFAEVEYSDQSEHHLVKRLRKSDAFIPELSLVAEKGGELVGHILLTRIAIVNGEQRSPSLALAPVSVLPTHQGQGIGGTLIKEAHKRAQALGHGSVILLGHADYYPRFGYRPTAEFGIRLPFAVPAENCMLVELQTGALAGISGVVEYPAAFME
ncbi:MAG: N-acetyltransferase [Cyanobacteria bacterium J06576_12]